MSDVYRNISSSGLTSPQYRARLDATMRAAFGYTLGRLTLTSGSNGNALTGTLLHPQGFTAYQDGHTVWFVALADNTSAVTLNVGGIGAVAVRDASGVELAAGVLVTGTAYMLAYDGNAGYYRLMSSASAGSSTASSFFVSEGCAFLDASGSWTAPYDCYVNIYLCGAAGSGAQVTDDDTTARATGGGGGEIGLKRAFFMEQGEQLDFTAGAGGAALAVSGTDANGNAGTASSVTGPNSLSMTANPGAGGLFAKSGAVAGAAGGTGGTGADVYWPGIASPSATSGDPTATCGGTFGLSASVPTLSANKKTAQDALDQISTSLGAFKWMARGTFVGSAGIETGSGTSADGGPGCGSGAGAIASDNIVGTGKGGDGFMFVEHSPPAT